MPNIVVLSDRIKETSNSTGTGTFTLDGAAVGFSAFSEFYSDGDAVYYAITDGSSYEVGSGVYNSDTLVRFPFRSKLSGSDAGTALVNFPVGVKEIYVTYPATHSVYTASGVDPAYKQPQASGLTFWESPNILNYDPSIIWDSTNTRLGLNTDAPEYAIDVGGDGLESHIRSSGVIVGSSGVVFPGGSPDPDYTGGRQVEHFVRNEIDTYTGADEVILLSGVVDQKFRFKTQSKGHVFAGPPSGCGVGCSPAYPSFRYLTLEDLPDMTGLDYVTEDGTPSAGYVTVWKADNVITFDTGLFFDTASNRLGIGTSSPIYNLDVVGNAKISTNLIVGGNLDVQGTTHYINSDNVTILDKQIELASMSGNRVYTDSLVDGAGIIIKSSGDGSSVIDGDKKWIWEDACNAWTAKGSLDQYNLIDVSGIIFNGDCNHIISGAYTAGSGLSLYGDGSFNLNVPSGSYANLTAAAANDADQVLVWDSGSHIFTYMSLGELETKVGGAGSSSDSFKNVYITDPGATFVSTASPVVADSATDSLYLVAGDHIELKADLTNDSIQFTNIGTPIVSGMAVFNSGELVLTSGILQGTIDNLSGITHEYSAGSGLIRYADGSTPSIYSFNLNDPDVSYDAITAGGIEHPSGEQILVWDDDNTIWKHMTFAQLQVAIGTGSGAGGAGFKTIDINDSDSGYVWGSVNVVADSSEDTLNLVAGVGIELRSDDDGDNAIRISSSVGGQTGTQSGVAVFNSSNVIVDTYENGSGMFWDSGNVSLSLGSVSDTVSSLFIDTVSSVRRGLIIQASDPQDQNLFEIRGSDGNISGIYIDGKGDFVGTDAGRGNTEFFAGSDAARDADSVDRSVFIGYQAGKSAESLEHSIGIGDGAASSASESDYSVFLGEHAGSNIIGKRLGGANPNTISNVGIGHSALQDASGITRTVAVGYLAGSGTRNSEDSVWIGNEAGYKSSGDIQSVFIGDHAGNAASDNNTLTAIGWYAAATGYTNDYSNMIGYKAGAWASGCTRTDMIGYEAGYDAESLTDSIIIGYLAGKEANNLDQSILIGRKAGYQATGCDATNMLGWLAGNSADDCDFTNLIGYQAGNEATGCNYTNIIGHAAGYDAENCSYDNMIGASAGYEATGCDFTNMIGYQAGYDSEDCSAANIIGSGAGYEATGCDSTNMIGSEAGWSADNCNHSNMIGKAGYSATGCNFTSMIGYGAGHAAKDCGASNIIGSGAGYEATGCYATNMIGRYAGFSADYASGCDMVGQHAGSSATGCTYTVILGNQAGMGLETTDHSVMIGHLAGANSKDLTRNIMIGYQTGSSAHDDLDLTVDGTCTGTNNVYIGSNAGLGHPGNNNISLISNSSDEFNPDDDNFSNRMNLGNTIFGITAHRDDTDHSMGRMIQIGEIPERDGTDDGIGATLAVKPDDAATSQPTAWLKRNSSQTAPILMSDTSLNYSSNLHSSQTLTGGSSTFQHINHHGVLTVPVFNSRTLLKSTINATANPGAFAIVWDSEYTHGKPLWCFAMGGYWWAVNDTNISNIGS